jgi:hypothetical protein
MATGARIGHQPPGLLPPGMPPGMHPGMQQRPLPGMPWAPGAPPALHAPPASTTVYVGKISPLVDDELMQRVLQACGEVRRCGEARAQGLTEPRG